MKSKKGRFYTVSEMFNVKIIDVADFSPIVISKTPVVMDPFLMDMMSWFYGHFITNDIIPELISHGFGEQITLVYLIDNYQKNIPKSKLRRQVRATRQVVDKILASGEEGICNKVSKDALADNLLIFWIFYYTLVMIFRIEVDEGGYAVLKRKLDSMAKREAKEAAKICAEISKALDKLTNLLTINYWNNSKKAMGADIISYLKELAEAFNAHDLPIQLEYFKKNLVAITGHFQNRLTFFTDAQLQLRLNSSERVAVEEIPYMFMHWLIMVLGLEKRTAARIIVDFYRIYNIKEIIDDYNAAKTLTEKEANPRLKDSRINNTLRQYQKTCGKFTYSLSLGGTNLISAD